MGTAHKEDAMIKTKRLGEEMLMNKLKLCEIADNFKISEGSLFTILHESLGMRKLFSKCGPSLLAPDQKQQRVEDSDPCLFAIYSVDNSKTCSYSLLNMVQVRYSGTNFER